MARLKNIEAFCNSCNSIQKMEIKGDTTGEDSETKKWAKCKTCKHVMLVDVSEQLKNLNVSLDGIENEDCTVYSPIRTFKIGESIGRMLSMGQGEPASFSKNTFSTARATMT